MNRYQKLCIKELTDEINDTEKKVLNDWLVKSEKNRKTFEEIKKVWVNSSPGEISGMPDIDSSWIKLLNRLIMGKEKLPVRESFVEKVFSRNINFFKTNWKPVLVGTLVLIIMFGSYFVLNRTVYEPKLKVVVTGNGEKNQVLLPDGTIVKLNSGSRIEFPEMFNNEIREVKLNGEAYFSVIKNKVPFVVKTDNAVTTVLGTKFDVWAREQKTKVIVQEGTVSLASSKPDAHGIILTKDYSGILTGNQKPSVPQKVDVEYLLGWLHDKLVFNKTPLDEIAVELTRDFNEPVYLENDDLKSYTLTGTFVNHNIDSVLTMICLTLDLSFEKQSSGYLIGKK